MSTNNFKNIMKNTLLKSLKTSLLRGGAIVVLTTMIGCDALKPMQQNQPKSPSPTNNPQGNQNNQGNVGTTRSTSKPLDTVQWASDPRSKPPITSNTRPPATNTTPTTNEVIVTDPTPNNVPTSYESRPAANPKSNYKISIVLPFYTNEMSDATPLPSKSEFALEFYAGVRLALDSLSQGYDNNFEVNVFDNRNTDFNALLQKYEVRNSDLLIGPIERDLITPAIQFSNERNVPVFSPYFPSGDLEGANPRFVQLKPSLKVHCEALVRHARSKNQGANFVLVANGESESSRFRFFQESNKDIKFKEWVISDLASANPETFAQLNKTTVFIVPSWNESFVSEILKKLDASPNRKNFVVYGMPQWLDFSRGLNEAFTRLQVRVSSSVYVNTDFDRVKEFRQRFFSKYGKFPNSDAFLGYDVVMASTQLLKKYGSNFSYYLDREQGWDLLHTRLNFARVNRGGASNDNFRQVMKMENQFVHILRFNGYGFKPDN
jgi:hypothetical protein